MKGFAYIERHYDDSVEEPFTFMERIRYKKELQSFTSEQLEYLPKRFRCYCCGDEFPQENLGGVVLRQMFCKSCYPYSDDWMTGVWIKFDRFHHYQIR